MSLLLSANAFGAYLRDVPQSVKQPNGVVIHCFATGDEFFNWLHDAAGYTIIQDPVTGYYVYAQTNADGELIPSIYPVGSVNPKAMGWAKWMLPSAQKLRQIRNSFYANQPPEVFLPAPKTGTINNIVIFIRFSDESEFTDSLSTYDTMFNSAASGANSMAGYFREVSYNALSISTTFYPASGTMVVSYQDANPRNYYQPYNSVTNPTGYQGGDDGSERTDREHTLLKNAVGSVSAQIPSGLVVDGDGDGRVDNICFIVSGSATGWASLLWPHQWALYSQSAYINNKQVWTYNFQLQSFLQSSGVGVLCHEMFHSIGAPDLYHYSHDGLHPAYTWDVMAVNSNPPEHMGAFMKFRYGTWISAIPEITLSGTYTLNPLTASSNNCYKIRSPHSLTEYYVLEYRRKMGTFESSVPGSGLLVYRINSARDGQGNRNGPPDEVYIYRPDGTVSANGSPDSAHFSSDVGRTAINDGTNPSGFLSTGATGGLQISSVTAAGTTISFTVSLAIIAPPTVTTSSVSTITQTTAKGGGNVTSVGGGIVMERGFCWGASANPTIAGSHTHDGTGAGSFVSSLAGLAPGSIYHGRAYATNSAGTSYGNDVPFTTLAAIALPQAVDNLTIAFTAGGNADWFGQNAHSFFGGDSAQSGKIGNNQSSSMETTVVGPLTLSFYWKVSSEISYDWLRFYIDGVEQAGSISGEISWTQKTFSIPAGSHTLKWAYSKDVSVSDGSDAGWVDKVNTGLGNPSDKDDLLGTWTGQGVYYRNSDTGGWTQLATPASKITAGDLDGDGIDDLIGIWPTQGGVWVKHSQGGAWAYLSSTADWIGAGDMNGDGRDELLGTWTGQGVYWRNNTSGVWTQLATPATKITVGDLDGDGTDDLIGIWPSQGGVWVKYSQSGAWAYLSSTADWIATGDMNGDGRDDLLGAWTGQGVYYRDSMMGEWVQMATPATMITAGDLDGDETDDLIGIWPSQGGVWVKFSQSETWVFLSSTANWIAAGRMSGGTWSAGLNEPAPLAGPRGGLPDGPSRLGIFDDYSSQGPGGSRFHFEQGRNLVPRLSRSDGTRIPGPGDPEFRYRLQKNLFPKQGGIKQQTKER